MTQIARKRKMKAAQWVKAALECGAEPYMIQHGPGAREPGSWWLATRGINVDRARHPGPFPDDCSEAAFAILDKLGRVHRAEARAV